MIDEHAQAIADKLVELSKSENVKNVVTFLASDLISDYGGGSYANSGYLLSWQGCPPYVLGAVLAIGMFLEVPEDVLVSDDLLPAIAKILREAHD